MTAEAFDSPNVAWCTTAQVVALPWFDKLKTVSTTLVDSMCLVASAWLWRASGRQWAGEATSTVRPVGPGYMTNYGPLSRANYAQSFDSRRGSYGFPFGYGRTEWAFEVLLGHRPVNSVGEVVIDGAALAASKYRVDDQAYLTRIDGQAWPWWQDWSKPSGVAAAADQQGTWQVTFNWGASPPADGAYAAQTLAGELSLAASDCDGCRLPNRVQTIARQGTSMLLADPQMLIDAGRWGIAEIDMFVASVNPHKLMQPASVSSPDIGRAVRRVGV